MPRTNFSDDQASGTLEQFPKLKLAANERVRILVPEGPWSEWTHELKAPKIENGVARMETKNRRDGTSYQDYAMEFIGRPICLGNWDVLESKGVDPANCPACAASVQSGAVPAPVRRFAVNVIQYAIMQGPAFQLLVPMSARIQLWAFTQKIYDKILTIQTQHGSLRERDLLLGPCEDANFQRYEIAVAMGAAHLESDQATQYVYQLWSAEGQRATDEQLKAACGRTSNLEFMTRDVNQATDRYAMARNAGGQASPDAMSGAFGAPAQTLGQGLAGLLPGTAPAAPAAPAAPPADPFAAPQPQQAPQYPHPEQVAAAAASNPFGAPPQQAQPAPQAPAPETVGFGPQASPGGMDQFAPHAQQPQPPAQAPQAPPPAAPVADPFAQPAAQPQTAPGAPQTTPQAPPAPAGSPQGQPVPQPQGQVVQQFDDLFKLGGQDQK
jgi:hypothetical protein